MDAQQQSLPWSACGLAGEIALLLERQTGAGGRRGHSPSLPDLAASPQLTIVGVDEAGRGCVAGPVVAGAAAWTLTKGPGQQANKAKTTANWQLMRDSKRLTAQRREQATQALTGTEERLHLLAEARQGACSRPVLLSCQHHLHAKAAASPASVKEALTLLSRGAAWASAPTLGVGLASCDEIESLNIWEATQLAIGRALSFLRHVQGPAVVFFDGKLPCKLPAELAHIPLITLVKADDRLRSVSAAGILAKVTRDQILRELDERFPHYGFAQHKGYGTADHFAAIRLKGLTPEHRPSFLSRVMEQPALF